jgi:hypothetical protein
VTDPLAIEAVRMAAMEVAHAKSPEDQLKTLAGLVASLCSTLVEHVADQSDEMHRQTLLLRHMVDNTLAYRRDLEEVRDLLEAMERRMALMDTDERETDDRGPATAH